MADILIVEDSRIQAEMLRRILVKAGHEVRIGPDGAEGLRLAQERRPDLLISDVTMPRMSGFELCERIRSDRILSSVPVILLTTMGGVEDVLQGLNAGADHYVTKPYEAELLLERVAAILARPSSVASEAKVELRAEVAGQTVEVHTGPQQMLNLLLSIYDNALEQNKLLQSAQDQLASLNAMLQADVRRSSQSLHQLEFYDRLTGLANRRLLLDRLTQSLETCTQGLDYGAVLAINLDDFRLLNDSKGYEVGDQLLLEVASRLSSDIQTGDTLARLGADELVLLVDHLGTSQEHATRTALERAERTLRLIQRPFDLAGEDYLGKASIGIALFGHHDRSPANILQHANLAMREAKRMGRNQARCFDDGMLIQVEARFLLENQLRQAIPQGLRLLYQKQVNLQGDLLGAEVLVRWQHPTQGMISPATFIPLAEETGLILPIGQWVLETACRQIKQWETHPSANRLTLAVNVSAAEIRQPDYVDQVLAILRITGANPTRLKLELTETALATDIEYVVDKMSRLRAHGVAFALDDFGTGFSSLTYLRKMPLDQLKIDRSFVREVTTNPHDASIVRTVIGLGQSLGLGIIAEGVETPEQRDFLASNGCQHFQGYLFGRPMTLDELETEAGYRA